jgi:hypothetical protein
MMKNRRVGQLNDSDTPGKPCFKPEQTIDVVAGWNGRHGRVIGPRDT